MKNVSKPLDDLRVVDATADRAGSIAGMLLADLGATVTRIESSDGRNQRPHPRELPDAVTWDRGKHTVVVSSFDPAADRELAALLDSANVLLIDPTPAGFDTSPLHPDRRTAGGPDLVTVWTPPYGAHGDRYRDLADDPLLRAALTAYALHQPAFDSERPIAPVVYSIEAIQGSLAASAAVSGALNALQSRTGELATVSAVDAAGALLATLVTAALDADEPYVRGRNPRVGPFFRPYRCGDGQMLFLATLVAPLFIKALDVLDAIDVMVLDGLDGDFLRLAHPDIGGKAAAILESKFATQPRDYWLERFTEAGVPSEAVLQRDEWLASDQFAKSCGSYEFDHPVVGRVTTPNHPARLSPRRAQVDPATVWPAAQRPANARGPLAGLRIVDASTFVAAPYASSVLAFWGADVVKVDPPEGDPYRLYANSYLAVNQCKRSVQLDVEQPDGRALFEALVADADVMIDNLRPSTRAKLGLDVDALAASNPALIHGTVTAFGPGPYEERPGFDPCIQAISGMMAAVGSPDEPLNTTVPVHDVATSASLAFGVLAALWRRAHTGEASTVTMSLAASSSLLQCAELTQFEGRPAPTQGDVDFVGASPANRFYRASDGWIGVAAPSTEALYAAISGAGSSPGDDIGAAIEKAIAERPVEDVSAALARGSIPAAIPVGATWGDDAYLDANQFTHVGIEPTFGRCRVMRGPGSWSRSGVAAVTEMVPPGSDTERMAAGGWPALHDD